MCKLSPHHPDPLLPKIGEGDEVFGHLPLSREERASGRGVGMRLVSSRSLLEGLKQYDIEY